MQPAPFTAAMWEAGKKSISNLKAVIKSKEKTIKLKIHRCSLLRVYRIKMNKYIKTILKTPILFLFLISNIVNEIH